MPDFQQGDAVRYKPVGGMFIKTLTNDLDHNTSYIDISLTQNDIKAPTPIPPSPWASSVKSARPTPT